MRQKLWEWIVRHFPRLLVFYYTLFGRTDSAEMKRVLQDIENKKTSKKAKKNPLTLQEVQPIIEPIPESHPISESTLPLELLPIYEKIQISPQILPPKLTSAKLPPLRDDGLILRREVDEAILKIRNADLLVGRNNIMISGNGNKSFIPLFIRKILEFDYNFCIHYNFVWFLNSVYKTKTPNSLTTFYIPYGIYKEIEWKNKYCFSLTKEEEYRVNNEEHLNLTYNNIMLNLPKMDEQYIKLLVLEIERYYLIVLDFIKPKLVIVWNDFMHNHIILGYLIKNKNIPFVFIESGSLYGTYILETRGQMGESLPARYPGWSTWLPSSEEDFVQAKNIITYLKNSNINRKKQPKTDISNILTHLGDNRPIVFFSGGYDMCSGICPYNEKAKKYHSPIFRSSFEAMLYLAKIAENNNWNLIYKPHPTMIGKGIEMGTNIPDNVIYIPLGDINEIVELADVTITILSTTAYVALIRDKPVVMLGYIHLRGQGCTYEAFEINKIESAISNAIENGYTEEQKTAFIEHIAKMCKYYLYDECREREISYGRPIEEAVKYIESVIEGTAEF